MIMPVGRRFGTSWKTVHRWVSDEYGRANEHECVDCGTPAQEWTFIYPDDVEYIKDERGRIYTMDINHYAPRCRSCHWHHDAVKDPEMAARRTARSAEVGRRNAGRIPWNKGA